MTLTKEQQHWILAGLIGVGGLGIIWYLRSGGVIVPSGTITDVQNSQAGSLPGADPTQPGNSPGYTGYNMPPITPLSLPTQQAIDNAAPAGSGGCCSKNNPCYSGSPLATGSAFSDLGELLTYYQNTNPYYLQLVKEQTAQYAALFVTGSSYGGNASFGGIAGI